MQACDFTGDVAFERQLQPEDKGKCVFKRNTEKRSDVVDAEGRFLSGTIEHLQFEHLHLHFGAGTSITVCAGSDREGEGGLES